MKKYIILCIMLITSIFAEVFNVLDFQPIIGADVKTGWSKLSRQFVFELPYFKSKLNGKYYLVPQNKENSKPFYTEISHMEQILMKVSSERKQGALTPSQIKAIFNKNKLYDQYIRIRNRLNPILDKAISMGDNDLYHNFTVLKTHQANLVLIRIKFNILKTKMRNIDNLFQNLRSMELTSKGTDKDFQDSLKIARVNIFQEGGEHKQVLFQDISPTLKYHNFIDTMTGQENHSVAAAFLQDIILSIKNKPTKEVKEIIEYGIDFINNRSANLIREVLAYLNGIRIKQVFSTPHKDWDILLNESYEFTTQLITGPIITIPTNIPLEEQRSLLEDQGFLLKGILNMLSAVSKTYKEYFPLLEVMRISGATAPEAEMKILFQEGDKRLKEGGVKNLSAKLDISSFDNIKKIERLLEPTGGGRKLTRESLYDFNEAVKKTRDTNIEIQKENFILSELSISQITGKKEPTLPEVVPAKKPMPLPEKRPVLLPKVDIVVPEKRPVLLPKVDIVLLEINTRPPAPIRKAPPLPLNLNKLPKLALKPPVKESPVIMRKHRIEEPNRRKAVNMAIFNLSGDLRDLKRDLKLDLKKEDSPKLEHLTKSRPKPPKKKPMKRTRHIENGEEKEKIIY